MSNQTTPPSDFNLPIEDDVPLPSDVPGAPVEPRTLADLEAAAAVVPTITPDEDPQVEEQARPTGDDEEAPVMVFTRTGVNPNSEMDLKRDPTWPLDPRKPWPSNHALYIVPCTAAEFQQMGINAPRLDPTLSEDGARWQNAVKEGLTNKPRGDRGVNSLTREDSMWRQTVNAASEDGGEIAAGRPKITDRMGSGALVGDEAAQFLQAMLGTGQVTRLPLWGSGIWVNMKAPTERQLQELDKRIANEKILLGRISNGLAFSNSGVYLSSYLANFALSMVFDCSISGFTVETLKKRIVLTDLPVLLWGLLCTMYPNGYRYYRPCVADPTKCTHVTEALLNISRLCWTDNGALTVAQRRLMQRKSSKFTNEELENYLSQHKYQEHRTVLLKTVDGKKTTIDLRVPTIADHEASGFSWVDGIVASTDAAFNHLLGGDERDDYIMDAARITSLRQYAHWIERINFEGGRYIEDRASLEELVGQLTGDQEVYKNFHEGVSKFIDLSTISLIAIPYYECPNCKKGQQTEEESKHPHLIPLDVQSVFFTLVDQRIQALLGMEAI